MYASNCGSEDSEEIKVIIKAHEICGDKISKEVTNLDEISNLPLFMIDVEVLPAQIERLIINEKD